MTNGMELVTYKTSLRARHTPSRVRSSAEVELVSNNETISVKSLSPDFLHNSAMVRLEAYWDR